MDANVILTDTLPSGVTFGQWLEQPAGLVRVGNAITWMGALTNSAAITFTFTATHTGGYGDMVTNTAYLSGATQTGSASAVFTVTQARTLTVGLAGIGDGSATSSPAGIACGADCSETYLYSAVVTLTAVPSTTSYFAGWSGAVSGLTNPISVTMDADKAVTATFNTYRIYLPVVIKST